MRRIIAIILIFSMALAIGGAYLVRPAEQVIAGECPVAELRETQRTIEAQTQLISAQDFPSARGYATQGFQTAVSDEQFAAIIARDYPFLLRNPKVTFTMCEFFGPQYLLVTVSFDVDGEQHQLDYAMINEQGGWFINSATTTARGTLAI